jgi:hypothetical protein
VLTDTVMRGNVGGAVALSCSCDAATQCRQATFCRLTVRNTAIMGESRFLEDPRGPEGTSVYRESRGVYVNIGTVDLNGLSVSNSVS